jgi:hypothetical protein
MPKITDYNAVGSTNGTTALADADVTNTDGASGVRKVTMVHLAEAVYDKLSKNGVGTPVGKSGIYRGANLGTGATFSAASTSAQRSAIADGTFTGLFVGDYWTINNRIYRIADFNYWKRSGDTDFNVNHLVIVPDANFGNDVMNDSNTTAGAYVGSKMYSNSSSVLNTARTTIADDFGGYLAQHRVYLANAVTDGAESGGAWFDSTVELMNEWMVYGRAAYTKKSATGLNYLYTIDKAQLALFKLNPAMVNLRYSYWLRNVASATGFAFVNGGGEAAGGYASYSLGVRPAFAVKGTA